MADYMGNSGKKQRNENNNATKSKLQKQDTVVGVVISVMFPKRRDTEMVKAIVKYDARRYDASVPPGTKIGDEVEILLHKGYVIHSSFRDDPLTALSRAGFPVNALNKKEHIASTLMIIGTPLFIGMLIVTLVANSGADTR